MATITRGTKAAGGTDFVDDTDALASEVNTDFNTIYTEFNGSIDETNFSGSISIPNSALATIEPEIVNDYSNSAAEARTAVTPGNSATAGSNLATDLVDEIERLRFRIGANSGTKDAIYLNSDDDEATVAWMEEHVVGENLIYNPGFEGPTIVSGELPTGWDLVGTPSATSRATAAAGRMEAGGHTRYFQISVDATGEGCSQTLQGLRANTHYLVTWEFEIVAAVSFTFDTQGGIASGNNYQDPTKTYAGTTGEVAYAKQIVQTGTAAGDVTVRCVSVDNSGAIRIYRCTVQEISDIHTSYLSPSIPTQTATHNSVDTSLPATWATSNAVIWEAISELALSQYVPGPNFRQICEVKINFKALITAATDDYEFWFRLKLDGSVVDGPYCVGSLQSGDDTTVPIHHIELKAVSENPDPGTTEAWTVEVGAYDGSGYVQMELNPLGVDASTQSISKTTLRTERMG